jgi:hypothetical protein
VISSGELHGQTLLLDGLEQMVGCAVGDDLASTTNMQADTMPCCAALVNRQHPERW